MARRERDRSQRSGSGSRKTVGQLGSSRSSGHQPEQLRGPRARIVQGRATRRCTMSAAIFVGMDISASLCRCSGPPGTAFQISHDERGIAEAVERLHAVQPTLIVLEATGGLEVPLAGALAAAALPVVVVNPRQVRDFARATGSSPRPIGLMPRSLRGSPRPFGLRFVPYRMNRPRPWRPLWRVVGS